MFMIPCYVYVVISWCFLRVVSLDISSALSCDSASLDSQAIFISLHSGVLKHKSDAAAPLRRAFQGCHCWDVLTPDLASVAPCTPAPIPDPPPPPSPGAAARLHRSFRVSLSTLSLGSFPQLLIPSYFGVETGSQIYL